MTAITGNTYPVKDQIKALGGKWDKDGKVWMVPDAKASEAMALVAAGAAVAPKPRHVRHTHCKQCGARPGPRGWPRIYRNGICSDCYRGEREEREMGY